MVRQGASNEVFQFSMPGSASDHSPSAQLVCIVSGASFGILAVSPYGQIRYWPRISESHRFTDASLPLSGDESCLSLLPVPGSDIYVIGTTHGRLMLVSLQMGAHNVLIREMRVSSSVLRTVGSWLGFGSNKVQSTDNEDQTVGLRITSHSHGAILWLLKANSLQAWRIAPHQPETLIFDHNIIVQFENALYEAQETQLGGRVTLDFTICDFQVLSPSKPSLPTLFTILIASQPSEYQESDLLPATLDKRGSQTEFHLATFEMHLQITSSAIPSSLAPKLIATTLLPEEMSSSTEYPSLTLSSLDSPSFDALAYVHWLQYALCASLPESSDLPCEIFDVTKQTLHRIFGSSSFGSSALYFTPLHGIVKLQLLQIDSLQNVAHPVALEESETKKTGFMAKATAEDILAEAFLRYMSQTSSQHLSSPAIHYPWSSLVETLWKLDFESATKSFSLQIVDSRPSEDPRWPEYAGHRNASSSGSNGSNADSKSDASYAGQLHALLYRQIEEKQEVHTNFIRFLVEVGIWDVLSIAAKDHLEQSSERLAAAAHLRAKHNEMLQQTHGSNRTSVGGAQLLQSAIELALTSKGISRSHWERAGLGAQDIYYAQVSKIESILEHALSVLKSQLSSKLSVEQQNSLILQNNDIFQSLISAAVIYRTQHAREFYEDSTRVDGEEEEKQVPVEFQRALVAASGAIGPTWTRSCHSLLRESIRISRQFVEQITQSRNANASKRLGTGFSSTTSLMDIDLDAMHDQLFHMTDALLSDWYQEVLRMGPAAQSSADVVDPGLAPSHSQQSTQQHRNKQYGRKREEEDLKTQYATIRSELIAPFKSDPSQYERALHLAEKYREFIVIVEICEAMGDSERLWKYARHFSTSAPSIAFPAPSSDSPSSSSSFSSEFNFERVVFEYYFMNKLFFKLLTPPHAFWPKLRTYLDETPDARKLVWIHMIRTGDYAAGETTFDALAQAETRSSLNQTTLLSLAKLSQLAQGVLPNQLNEVREARIYLRNAQLAIRAMFDHTDEDSVPEHSPSLVARLLECAHGNESIQPGYSLQLALDLWRNTVLLRTPNGNQELLESIWQRIMSLEHWSDLAVALQRGEIDDRTLEENVQGSLFFNVAINAQNIREELPANVFIKVVQSIYGKEGDKATMRVLASAFELAYRAKGLAMEHIPREELRSALIGRESEEEETEEHQEQMEEEQQQQDAERPQAMEEDMSQESQVRLEMFQTDNNDGNDEEDGHDHDDDQQQ